MCVYACSSMRACLYAYTHNMLEISGNEFPHPTLFSPLSSVFQARWPSHYTTRAGITDVYLCSWSFT